MNYRIRRVTTADMAALSALYKRCFDEDRSATWLAHKFATGPLGDELIGCVALTGEGELAAFYGVFPLQMCIGERQIKAAQSGDTMTHPEHRKRGLFVRLAQATYALAREQGFALIYGFPNAQSRPGFVKLDWTFREPLQVYRFSPKRSWWARLRRAHPAQVAARLQTLSVPLADACFAGSSQVVHDAAYLSYKQGYEESLLIKVDEVRLWVKPGARLDVGDLDAPGSVSDEALKSTFNRLLSNCGAKSLRFTFHPESPWGRRLAPICEAHAGQEPGFYILDDTLADALNNAPLYFSRGDFDFF
ncbi:MAG: GNAT family N-acetyltransferase [Pseudomonadota bacterium]